MEYPHQTGGSIPVLGLQEQGMDYYAEICIDDGVGDQIQWVQNQATEVQDQALGVQDQALGVTDQAPGVPDQDCLTTGGGYTDENVVTSEPSELEFSDQLDHIDIDAVVAADFADLWNLDEDSNLIGDFFILHKDACTYGEDGHDKLQKNRHCLSDALSAISKSANHVGTACSNSGDDRAAKLAALTRKRVPDLQPADKQDVGNPLSDAMEPHLKLLSGVELYWCRHCAIVLCDPIALRVHESTHAGVAPYQCGHCSPQESDIDDPMHVGGGTREETPRGHGNNLEHASAKMYHCSFCKVYFLSSSALRVHRRIHTKERPYQCNFCGKAFSQARTWRIHQRIHTGEEDHACSYCARAFSDPRSLGVHEQIHRQRDRGKGDDNEEYHHDSYCDRASVGSTGSEIQWDEDSTDRENSEAHMRIHTPGVKPRHQCRHCNRSYLQRRNLVIHEKVHAIADTVASTVRDIVKEPFKCSECGAALTNSRQLTTHMRSHWAAKKRYPCRFCSKAFSRSNSLRNHEKIHTGERPFACPFWPKAFCEQGILRVHMRTHTGESQNVCGFCGKAFWRTSSLRNHELIHTGMKNYECRVCGKGYIQLSHLKIHERRHTGHRPYSCGRCEKAFTSMAALKSHYMVHTRRKPFECRFCSKSFGRSDTLMCHERIHTDERPYPCQYCEKSFREPRTLNVHVRTHTAEPFRCTICDGLFKNSSTLEAHRKTHKKGKRKSS